MEKIENIKKPFMCYCAKVIPLAFDESMSYYETLCNFYNYLKNEVMPVINQNASATAELQELFVELENYVNNYFENLDIQTEIDNKLDEMVESGTLATLITEYLKLKNTYTFNNIEDLLDATNLVNGCYARTSGFYEYNDKGGAIYLIRTYNNDSIDDIHIFRLSTLTTLVAELIPTESIDVRQLGAKNNQDNKAIIQYALNNYKIIKINEMYEVYSKLEISHNNTIIEGLGGLYINHSKNDDLIKINGYDNITIKDISLTNDSIRYDSVSPDMYFIINCINSNYITLDNIKVYNAYNRSCDFESSHYITILNSNFKNCYYDMVTILHESSDILVDNCVFDTVTTTYDNAYLFSTGSYNYSINAEYLCKNVTVQNSKFLNNLIWEGIDSHGCQNLQILNNYVYNCKDGIVILYDTRKSVTNKLGDDVIVKNNVITGDTDGLRSGITVYGSSNHFIKNIIISDNIINNYSNVSGIFSINIGYLKEFTIESNTIKQFTYGGIQTREVINGTILNNHIYDPKSYSGWGIYNLENSWLVTIKNNQIHGTNYFITRGVNCGTTRGCYLIGYNDIYNCDYRYTSATPNSSPLGTMSASYPYRLGCKGIKSIDQYDNYTAYCTDEVIRGSGETLSNLSITSDTLTRTIELPSGQSILNYCTIGEEIVISGAGVGGADLTTVITDILSERVFIIKDTIQTAVSNVHPSTTDCTWVSYS